jgi:hypothetical protein
MQPNKKPIGNTGKFYDRRTSVVAAISNVSNSGALSTPMKERIFELIKLVHSVEASVEGG